MEKIILGVVDLPRSDHTPPPALEWCRKSGGPNLNKSGPGKNSYWSVCSINHLNLLIID